MEDFNCICEATDRAVSGVYVDNSVTFLVDAVDKHFLFDVAKLKASADPLKYTRFQESSHVRLFRIYVSASLVNHI